ncbi:adenylate/guanylate cyclase [Cribrihabitans marinus]|uniref:Adenylate/guanylate cyclase n=1 Tax=Cribrihabitans marinus TaxID=1227549 RepID=A0A1H6XXE1_9RHOB|nr:DUF427 domain-containing protein [Cribrihabitans marinus]GGH27893.1 hypothetical protein GCM10010973_16450 [Cribrihabitans marinus]SEJ31447.1 adenylate/guanylate cyclase [Cribrihabitans marinus]
MLQVPEGRPQGYGIEIRPLPEEVRIWRGGVLLAQSRAAKVMYETRLAPTVYVPRADIRVPLGRPTELQTFCPFKGTARYFDLRIGSERFANAAWAYDDALPESAGIQGHVGFMPDAGIRVDLGRNILRPPDDGNISGPLVDWLMRGASAQTTPEDFTRELARKLTESGLSLSRLSVLIWSLHPLIAGKHHIWDRESDEISTFAPSYEIHDHPSFRDSPLRHVSNGRGGVRQRIDAAHPENSFPIIEDLRSKGATDYVAMPLPFSDGRINVLTLTSDAPGGFTTAQLGLVFEVSSAVARAYEVFVQRETAQVLLETYVGKRSGARVLGGEIRRGDGDEIDAAIMFCDLRRSTLLEERLGRAAFIALLNRFFETVSDIVQENGGEVLKFIGDAVLAVFPAEQDSGTACRAAARSALEITARLDEMRGDDPEFDGDCSIGLSFGRVTYGNVGSRERLDFTVIGQAANVAARLGDYGKRNSHRIVASADVLPETASSMPLGPVQLRNVTHPVQAHAVVPPALEPSDHLAGLDQDPSAAVPSEV